MERATRKRWATIFAFLFWSLAGAMFAFGWWNAREETQRHADQLAALSTRDEIIEQLRESALHGNVITDEYGKVVSWNKAMEAMTGWTAEEMTGSTLERIMAPEDWRRHRTSYPDFLRDPKSTNKVLRFDCQIIRKDGRTIPVVVRAVVVRSSNRKPYSMAFVDRESRILDLTKPAEHAAK